MQLNYKLKQLSNRLINLLKKIFKKFLTYL